MPNLVIVSNRLPVSVKKVDGKLEFSASTGGLATGLSGYTNRPGTKWIGWPGIASDDLTTSERSKIARELKKQRCYPLFLSQKEIDDFYSGFSNGVLWPLFHNLPVRPHKPALWQAYKTVNERYTEEVLKLTKPHSTIWVHDYQLLLMPQQLRRAGHDGQIGFFLHTPFPNSDTLDVISESKSLLRGILGADLVGFHTKGYTHNFIECCDRQLGLSGQHGQVLLGTRPIRITEFPIGIDYSRFAEATRQRKNRKLARQLHKKYKGQKVIVGVDRLDPSKGLTERLKAYQMLLRQSPQLAGKVVLVMIVAPSRTDVPEYKKLKQDIDKLLKKIDTEFKTERWQPVDFIYRAVPLDEVISYYQMADVGLVTPVRDGMNLVAKEFLASKRRNDGVLVLSETAGAAEELHDAILVNPAKPQTIVDGLLNALSMPKRELRRRARDMQAHIRDFPVQKWADTFMETLQQPRKLVPSYASPLNEQRQAEIITDFRRATKRLWLFDYDGVLRRFKANPAAALPTEQLMELLTKLSADPANEIVVISGRSKVELGEWFGKLPIALAAEHGALFRRKSGKNWHSTSASGKFWKNEVRAVFEHYAGLTPGAIIEKKEWSLAWHYRAANPYYAQKNLVVLRRLLKPIAKQYGLNIEEGHKVLEVRPKDINKGRVAREWLLHDYDFIVAMGDDTTDEDMFAALPPGAYSIKVGRGKTFARYRLKDVAAVLQLLGRF